MDNAQQIVTSEPQNIPSSPLAKVPKRIIFTAAVLVILIIIDIGAYFWHHRHHTNASRSQEQSTQSTQNTKTALSSTVKTPTNNLKTPVKTTPLAPTTTSSVVTSTTSNDLAQLGIKIPLSSTISDLGYVWESSGGYNDYPYAILGSKQLMLDAEKDDPANCTNAIASETGGIYPLGYVYSSYWDDSSSDSNEIASTTVSNNTYYLYSIGTGVACDKQDGASFQDELISYYNTLVDNFTSSISDK